MSSKFLSFDKEDCISKYFKDIKDFNVLSQEEEIELAKRVQNGDELAQAKLIEANLKFVISIAKEYQGNGISLNDLINEGNYGLIKAATKFDHTKGFKFISYAVWWIKQSIIQSLNDNSKTIRLPPNVYAKISNDKKELERLKSKNLYDLNDSLEIYKEVNVPTCTSFNLQINDDGDELYDLLYSDEFDDTCVNDEELIKNELNGLLSTLNNREREIIECYYGLNDKEDSETLEIIGNRFNLTKERVRQIKEKAIRKLRFNSETLYDLVNSY